MTHPLRGQVPQGIPFVTVLDRVLRRIGNIKFQPYHGGMIIDMEVIFQAMNMQFWKSRLKRVC